MRINWPIVKLFFKIKIITVLQLLRLLKPDEVFYVGSTEICHLH